MESGTDREERDNKSPDGKNRGNHEKQRDARRLRTMRKWLAGVIAAALVGALTAWMAEIPSMVADWLNNPNSPIILTSVPIGAPCNSYISASVSNSVAPPPPRDSGTNEQYADWARENELATLQWSKILVTVKGTSDSPVVINGISFEIVDRTPLLSGASYGGECGSETSARYAVVDLDKKPPKITASTRHVRSLGDPSWRTDPLQFPYTVTGKDTESLLLIATTNECACKWRAHISWSTGEKSGTSTIDDKGQPFFTSGYGEIDDGYIYDEKTKQWVEIG